MRHRISCCVFVMAAAVAFHGIVTAQSLNYSDAVTVPQVDSKMPKMLDDRQLKGNVLDRHGNQVGRNVGPNETIFVNGNAKIKYTQGGDDIVKKSGDAIGVVRPSGESHWFRDVKQGSMSNIGNQNGRDVDKYSCAPDKQCRTEKSISNGGNAGWRSANEAAYRAGEQLFIDGQCFAGQDKEAAFLILQKGNEYFYGYKSEYVNNIDAHSSAPVTIARYEQELAGQGYSVVGVVHNHPLHEPNVRTIFSKADKDSARTAVNGKPAVDCYMLSCDDSSMGDGGKMTLYRYVKSADKAYIVNDDGSQMDAPDYIAGADIDTSKPQTESPKSKSTNVSDNSLATANESVPTVMKKAADDSKDVKKALEEFHIKFLSLPNSHFKWQQIQAYLDLVVSLESWTLPPEKVLNKLVQEGSIIRTRNNTWKDLVESPLASDDSKSCWVKEKVGICGWCRCQPPHKTPKYKHAWLGAHVEAWAFDGQREQNDVVGLLSFPVCKQCGKCYTYRRMGDDSEEVKFHVGPYEEDVDEHISQTHKIVAARKKMEDAILSIPDGEIVVPIKRICQCKHSRDKKPNIFAFCERQGAQEILRRYICADCSGLYSPKDVCNLGGK